MQNNKLTRINTTQGYIQGQHLHKMDTQKQKSRTTQKQLDQIKDIWEIIKTQENRFKYTAFDPKEPQKVEAVKRYAKDT